MTRPEQALTDESQARGQELALWDLLREEGSPLAREALFKLFHPFAKQLARRHWRSRSSPDIELGELDQLAAAGLLEAMDRYDPRAGSPFKAFAARRIAGSIIDGIGKLSEYREQISFRSRIRRERARSLAPKDSDSLSTAEALDALADMALGLALGFILQETGANGSEQAVDQAPSPYDQLAWRQAIERIAVELEVLPDRSKSIIKLHYLDGVPFGEIAEIYGLSKGRVSQLHAEALRSVRSRINRALNGRQERWDNA